MTLRIAAAIGALLLLVPGASAQEQPPRHALSRGAPWQAQIYTPNTVWNEEDRAGGKQQWELAHKCGGSLITAEWVLTAAHCINRERIKNRFRVRLGVLDLRSEEGVTYLIDRMVRHRRYNPDTKVNDIALVHLKADDLTDHNYHRRIKPIPLYDGPRLGSGTEVTVSGWGKDESDRYVPQLMQADLAILECNDSPDYRDKTTPDMLCAAAPGKDACKGDSGGPLVLSWGEPKLVGIVSWGIGCGQAGKPGVYVRLDSSHYLDWIKRAMQVDPSIDELD